MEKIDFLYIGIGVCMVFNFAVVLIELRSIKKAIKDLRHDQ